MIISYQIRTKCLPLVTSDLTAGSSHNGSPDIFLCQTFKCQTCTFGVHEFGHYRVYKCQRTSAIGCQIVDYKVTHTYMQTFCHQWFWIFFHWLDDGRWDCLEISWHFRGKMLCIAILFAMRYFNDMGYKCTNPEFLILNLKWKSQHQLPANSIMSSVFLVTSLMNTLPVHFIGTKKHI